MYFSAANPGMKYGGVMGESKYKVLSSIPEAYVPKTIFISGSTSFSSIIKIISQASLRYPFIIKPDVGERGKDVEIIRSETELRSYLHNKSNDLILQEYIDYELEFGLMYHRLPGSPKGHVTSMVQKGFLSITGDGIQTIKALISHEIRAKNRLEYLYKKFEPVLNDIPSKGERIRLEPIGNHCRGTTFHNANHLINDNLLEVFNTISMEIEGFFYGRFDLKVPSLDDLYAGKNIKILELNGVSSEVAHVYDPDYSLIKAYRDIMTHMGYIYQIAQKNHELGVSYNSLWKFLKDLRKHLKG